MGRSADPMGKRNLERRRRQPPSQAAPLQQTLWVLAARARRCVRRARTKPAQGMFGLARWVGAMLLPAI